MALIQLFNAAVPNLAIYPTPTPNIGGGKGTSNIGLGSSISQLCVPMAAALAGGNRYQIAYFAIYNSNTVDYVGASVNLINSLLAAQPSGGFFVNIYSDSALDGNLFNARLIGTSTAGTPQPLQDNSLIMNGLTSQPSGVQFTQLFSVESRNVNTSVLTPTNGNWYIYAGSTLIGIMPKGYYSCTCEWSFALVGTLNDTTTYTSCGTAPSGNPPTINGLTLVQPNTVLSGVPMANGGVLTAGSWQGGWGCWTVAQGRLPSPDLQVVIMTDGAFYS